MDYRKCYRCGEDIDNPKDIVAGTLIPGRIELFHEECFEKSHSTGPFLKRSFMCYYGYEFEKMYKAHYFYIFAFIFAFMPISFIVYVLIKNFELINLIFLLGIIPWYLFIPLLIFINWRERRRFLKYNQYRISLMK